MKSIKKKLKTFKAVLEKAANSNAVYVSVPFNVEREYGKKGQVKVKATFDGHSYRGILANMGTGCHIIGVRKDIREAIGKRVGDVIAVTLTEDKEERKAEVPADLKAAFRKHATAEKFFGSLSYTNQKEFCVWIDSARKDETRTRRLRATIDKLLAGKKNPSEK